MKLRKLFLSLLILLSVPVYCDERRVEWTLGPGESYTFEGVTVTWEFPEKSTTFIESKGWLNFVGPKRKLEKVLFAHEKENRDVEWEHNLQFFIDGVAFRFIKFQSYVNNAPDTALGLIFEAAKQPEVFEFDSTPDNLQYILVSNNTPITLLPWQLTITDSKVRYADGTQMYQLIAKNTKSGTKISIPIQKKVRRQFGRYEVSLGEFVESTLTLAMRVDVNPDLTTTGKDAYVERFEYNYRDPVPDVLNRLSSDFNIQIEWKENPAGYPDSITYGKDRDIGRSPTVKYTTLSKLVDIICKDAHLDFEWLSSTRLQIWSKDYPEYLEREAKKEKYKKEVADAKEKFETEYALQTKFYKLVSLSPKTAEAVIEPLLSAYSLYGKEISTQIVYNHVRNKATEIMEKKEVQPDASVTETVVADEKSGTLIVSAIASTHKKIEEVLQRTDRMVAAEAASKPLPKQYKIELNLLQGLEGTDSSSEEATHSFLKQAGISKDDLQSFGLNQVKPIGQGVITISGERGEIGKAFMKLGENYQCELSYMDERKPYLIVKVRLVSAGDGIVLVENSLFLEKGKPSLLGLTNLRDALILLVKENVE